LSYGGTINGIYSKILVKVPEMNLSLTQFTKIVNDYFDALPNYKKWREMITKQAVSTRCVETAFGRKRFLLGMPGDIEREALNTPIQGTAGEVLLRALIDLDEVLLKKFPDAMLVDTVHDSILADVKDADALAVAKLGKKVMERPFKLFGREVRFPVDTEIGPSWGETEKVDL
jgi:DNA polymerase-1